MAWEPILGAGATRARALDAVREIATDLASAPLASAGVAGGKAGVAIFFAYLEQAGLGGGERADALLGEAITAVAETAMPSSLYSGFPGVAWATEHLTGGASEGENDVEDPNEEIDAALHELLSSTPWRLDYDLVIGLTGLGVYGLERAHRAGGRRTIELVVDRLDETAVEVAGSPGATWWTAPELMIADTRAQNAGGYYNAGLAHGSPGPIALLAAAIEAGIAEDKARPLLARAVAWLLAQRSDHPGGGQFPYAVTIPPRGERAPVRAAWCYGDPGVTIALLAAARAAGEPRWEAVALEVARRAAERPEKDCGVKDAGLCHGAAGLAHVYNRFYQATREPSFRDAALAWTERLLAMHKPGEGVGGFLAWGPGSDGELAWVADPSLLTGAAGIGLALLGLTTEHEPRWDRFLLTDVRPR